MPENDIDLKAVIEQLQHENERLREALAHTRIKVHGILWDAIYKATINLFSDVHYILGICTGIFLMILINIVFEERT